MIYTTDFKNFRDETTRQRFVEQFSQEWSDDVDDGFKLQCSRQKIECAAFIGQRSNRCSDFIHGLRMKLAE